MKKVFCLTYVFCFLFVACVTTRQELGETVLLELAIQSATDVIENSLQNGQIIAVLNFSSPSEQFSNYILDELTNRIVNGRKLVVVDRSELDLIRQEENFQMSGEVSDESIQSIGQKLGAQFIVSGSLTTIGNMYRFRIRVLNVRTAVVEASSFIDISATENRVEYLLAGTNPAPELNHSGMVYINGGSFMMGSPRNEPGRDFQHRMERQHRVTVDSFYMGHNPVTVGEFRYFVENSGYITDAERRGGGIVRPDQRVFRRENRADANWRNPYFIQGDDHPVVLVSWFDAVRYCNWLSQKEGLTPAYTVYEYEVRWNRNANGYRLPTEAEWEYACRAGTTTAFNTGSYLQTNQANYRHSIDLTTAVGSYPSNPWGLNDMHGNVREWCWDVFNSRSYPLTAQINPAGPDPRHNEFMSTPRVQRGGSWASDASQNRSANRSLRRPAERTDIVGFRLAKNALLQ